MLVLQIEHLVADFDRWKKAFEDDPMNRKDSGVRSYRVFRATLNPNYVIIDLEFDNLQEAEAMHGKLKTLWASVEGKVMTGPQARIIETVDSVDYER